MNATHSRVSPHPVTETANRLYGGTSKLSPQPADKYLNCVRIPIKPLSVDMFGQFAVRDDFSTMVHQIRENAEFVARQLHRSAFDGNFHCSNIKHDGTATKLTAPLSSGPANQRPNARQDLFCSK